MQNVNLQNGMLSYPCRGNLWLFSNSLWPYYSEIIKHEAQQYKDEEPK